MNWFPFICKKEATTTKEEGRLESIGVSGFRILFVILFVLVFPWPSNSRYKEMDAKQKGKGTKSKGKGKGSAGYSVNIPRQLKKLGLTKDKYIRLTFRDGYVSGSCIDGSIFLCQVLNAKEIKDMMTFKEPKHNLFCFTFRHPLLITVCDDWKLRVQNIDNDLKQKFPIPVPKASADDMNRKNRVGSDVLKISGGSFANRAQSGDAVMIRRRTAVLLPILLLCSIKSLSSLLL